MTMSNKSAFANNYEDFSDAISSSFLNESKDGISESFKTTLNKFKDTKLHHLKSKMGKDIFYDGSVYTGSAGLALYYFMLGIRKPGSHEHLKTALEYIDLNSLKGKRISFLCGDAGPLAIATVISYKLGNKRPHTLPEYNTLVDRLLSLASLISSSPDEILYGKSGYLYALLFVNKHVPEKSLIPAKHFEKVISSILNSGRQLSAEINSESPMMWQWHEKIYFGAAHGMAGILYMLLQARTYMTDADLHNLVKPTINWLLKQRFSSGNFPSSMGSGSGDRLVQWCHGAPGFVSLCTLAAEVFKEDKYLKIAQKSCDVVWERGLCTKGYSICHGVSGNAYAFLQMYQATMEPMYLYRACCFMEWCVLERKGTELHAPDRPASMFEGLVGRLYLAEDVTQAFNARFPAYSLE